MSFDDEIALPKDGVPLFAARAAICALRNRMFVNRRTGIAARLSASAQGKLVSNKATGKSKANGFSCDQHNAMAIKLEALDRIVEVASGSTPHASSASTSSRISFHRSAVNGGFDILAKQVRPVLPKPEALKTDNADTL